LRRGIGADKLELANPMWQTSHTSKYLLVALIFAGKGENERALSEFGQYEDAHRRTIPNYPPFYLNIKAQLLADNGQSDEAKRIAEQVRNTLEPHDALLDPYWYSMGCIELAEGNISKAVDYLERMTLTVTDFPSYYMMAKAYLNAGRIPQAIETFERLLSAYTIDRAFWGISSVHMHYYLGRAYQEQGRIDDAIHQYEEFLAIWENADPIFPTLEDAQMRLDELHSLP